MATQAASQQANPIAVLRQNLTVMAPEFKAALPPHITVEKFTRVAQTAIQNTPALAGADRRSLFGAFVKLAQDGLLPDGREAAVVMFGNKAQAMPMIGGILKRIRQSGEVARVSAQVVYANDEFVVRYGFDEDVEHVPPKLDQPRGEPIGAYATAVLKDGSKLLEVMSLEEIEKVRAVSRAARNGPWVAWWTEMARKTVMRRLSKRLPMSTDIEEEVFSRDETLQVDSTAIREISKEPDQAAPVSRLDAIEHQIGGDEPEETPEVEEQAEELEAEIRGPDDGDAPEQADEPDTNTNDAADADPAQEKCDSICRSFDKAEFITDLGARWTEAEKHRPAMTPEQCKQIDEAYERNRIRLGGKVKAAAKEPAA